MRGREPSDSLPTPWTEAPPSGSQQAPCSPALRQRPRPAWLWQAIWAELRFCYEDTNRLEEAEPLMRRALAIDLQ
jgi:hypothetical protein